MQSRRTRVKKPDCFINKKRGAVDESPFVITDEDVTDAAPELILIEEDDDVNIEDID